MSQKQVGQGIGNTKPDTESKRFLASAAITAGQVVSLDGTVTGITGAYKIVPADSDSQDDLDFPVGVALDDIAEGAWGDVTVSGYCRKVLTDGTVSVGDLLVPHTTAGQATVMAAGEEHLLFGRALETDSGTPAVCQAILLKRV